MRTTVNLPDELLLKAKQEAVRTNRTFTAVVEDALRQHLAQKEQLKRYEPVRLHTCDGDGLQPGIDLDKTASLLDTMEQNGQDNILNDGDE